MEQLLQVNDRGLYCQRGDFYIDPWRPVETALITHAHGDHCYRGMGRYIAHAHSCSIMRIRYGFEEQQLESVAYGESFELNGVGVTFFPAGHILGSAQIRLEAGDRVWVVSGDYKRAPDPTAQSFVPLRSDVFVTEATFALPVFQWRDTRLVVEDVLSWWQSMAKLGKPALLYAYSLGKAQRLLAELQSLSSGGSSCYPGPLILHNSCVALTEYYQEALNLDFHYRSADDPRDCSDWQQALVIAPPSAEGGRWIKRLTGASQALASGWMALRGSRRRRAMDQGFVISDHADWPALIRTVEQSKASKVLVTHGYNDVLARFLRENHRLEAEDLKSLYEGEGE
ncbi:ligase-associated DNA damage response exonuclease [Pseudobacteriovorax antillogorgiicola]|uniref:Putative mRNA 3-end processing factor n=1 Tax=Pseudobacteriovorax antillogorgiicola TaxID=1513793 RepID=A0A1Y6C313_9BACT|nr:ligase-associated DNA damage response exonuclease [Pseudobacteriovorax antillogorgiicola]TCS49806.1 putative mRNA 3-end processing factor [Pseudobacteriovorax antillogorgiicola]SMF43082.1 putative mRNA 3-end processing factor [Pseudobacteriovorax antillogorgiicola]